jgi:V/A-type H+-transporting ATPase subunit F
MKVAVVGDADITTGFGLIGVHSRFIAEKKEEVEQALSECLDDPDVGVVILPAPLAGMVRDSITRIQTTGVYPLFVEIPAKDGPTGEDVAITRLIGRAVGISLQKGGVRQ